MYTITWKNEKEAWGQMEKKGEKEREQKNRKQRDKKKRWMKNATKNKWEENQGIKSLCATELEK